MPYSVAASDLDKIYNRSFKLRTREQEDAVISITSKGNGWPRTGSEAIGLRTVFDVNRKNGKLDSMQAFLKIFKTEVPERAERINALISMGLAKKHEAFYGIPFGWLGKFNINGVELIGHFTRMIPGPYSGGPEDFGRLRGSDHGLSGWAAFSRDDRKRFSGELAAAVAGLEACGIIHGDISPGNLLIGQSKRSGQEMCILCDYDGYYSTNVEKLPRKHGKMPCRPLGSPGYQYPALKRDMLADKTGDADIWVETDRFALGVAICEMMTWSDLIERYLEREGRDNLLSDEMVIGRDVGQLPKDILDSFPEGFRMLDRSLKASSPTAMPSPEDWLHVLGFDEPPVAFSGSPDITVFWRQGTGRRKVRRVHITRTAGNFGLAVSELAALSYKFEDRLLTFEAPKELKLNRRRDGILTDIQAGIDSIVVNPGDVFYLNSGAWELEVVDSPRPPTQSLNAP